MASLLAKLRIDFSALKVIPDITKQAQPKTKEFFDSLIADYQNSDVSKDSEEGLSKYMTILI